MWSNKIKKEYLMTLMGFRRMDWYHQIVTYYKMDGQKDSSTKWSDYENFHFKNCVGSLKCPQNSCSFLKEYGYKNRFKFN